jgi:hypothetical protein
MRFPFASSAVIACTTPCLPAPTARDPTSLSRFSAVVCVFIVWDVIDSAPALDAPAFAHLLLKGFSGSADADPGLADVPRRFVGAQRPDFGSAVADLMIHGSERDFASSLVLAADLAVQRLLVGPLLRRRLLPDHSE